MRIFILAVSSLVVIQLCLVNSHPLDDDAPQSDQPQAAVNNDPPMPADGADDDKRSKIDKKQTVPPTTPPGTSPTSGGSPTTVVTGSPTEPPTHTPTTKSPPGSSGAPPPPVTTDAPPTGTPDTQSQEGKVSKPNSFDCHEVCEMKSGYCDECGNGMACCLNGEEKPAECTNIDIPDVGHHVCVVPGISGTPDTQSQEGKVSKPNSFDCHEVCEMKSGYCDECGKGMACCLNGEEKPAECTNIDIPDVGHHVCVDPGTSDSGGPTTVKPAPTTEPTINPDNAGKEAATTAAPSKPPVQPTDGPSTSPTEEKEAGPVEGSKNDTYSMEATTFHVAVRCNKEKYSDDLAYPANPMFIKTKQDFLKAVDHVYDGDKDYKQCVIIKFTDSEKKQNVGDGDSDSKRNDIGKPGVIVDFYLRFYTKGTHLVKLTNAIKTGKLDTHPVSKQFVRAYAAEPHGRVCTPDCKVQCYSYCDQGCCHVHFVQNLELPAAAAVGSAGVTDCQGAGCAQQVPAVPAIAAPCQGAACAAQAPAAAPCQGASCLPPMPVMMPMAPVAVPCQGAACAQQQSAAPCQGPSCFSQQPAPYPNYIQSASRQQAQCHPSCQQSCTPVCQTQCCTNPAQQMGQTAMQFAFPQAMPFQQIAPAPGCGPRGC